jgi:tRNA(Ile2) C34 agmatinyltransferase TiaS
MSQDDVEQILPGWQAASEAAALELAEWRRAHPKASLTEIEAAVFEAMQKLQTQAMGEVVQASTATDLAALRSDERPRCPTCGGQLEPRGRQRRRVRPARQRAALDLDRSYAVCATCGAGLFPPG